MKYLGAITIGAVAVAAFAFAITPSPAYAAACQKDQIVKNINPSGGAYVKNISNSTCDFYLASYEINFTGGGSWPYIQSQTLHAQDHITLGPGESGNLSVSVPACEYQLDLVNIPPIEPPTYSSGNFLGVQYGGPSGVYCNGQTSPPPSPPPITPPPTTPPPTADIKANNSDGPITITSGTAATLSWTSANATSCTVNPGGFPGTSGTASTGNLSASQTYTVTCAGAGGTASDTVTVNVQAVQTITADIKANGSDTPITIQSGTAANLTWTSSGATACTVTPGNFTGTTGTASTGNLTASQTYTLSCTGPGGTASDTVTVNVQAQQNITADIKANGQDGTVTIQSGTSANLTWTSSGATACTVTPGGFTGTSGSASTGNLSNSQTYTLSCTGAAGTATDTVTVNVTGGQCVPPSVVTASATNVTQNSATLNGTVINSGTLITTAFFEYGTTQNLGSTGLIFTIPAATTRQITNDISNLAANTTYFFRLVAQNSCGGANIPGAIFSFTTGTGSTVTPTVDIKANGQDGTVTVQNNTSALITWTSSNANSCVVSPTGWTGTSGSQNSQNITGTITFVATCTGVNGQTVQDSVTVQPTGGTGTPPTVNLTANPTSILQGQSSTLSWTSSNATTCYASGGPWSGTKALSGSELVTPSITSTYTITCTNSFGSASDTETVFVTTTGGTGSSLVTKLVRNVTLNQITFLQSADAQGLDTLEFEIRVRNTDSVARTMTVQDILPAELFYVPGSTTVDGVTAADGITTGGLNLGIVNPNQERVVRFRAVVFFGTGERTITNQAAVTGAGSANAYANVVIRNRGTVLGAADIVTGADDALPLAAAIGFVLAVIVHWTARKRGWYQAGAKRLKESKRNIEDVLANLAKRAQESYLASNPDEAVL